MAGSVMAAPERKVDVTDAQLNLIRNFDRIGAGSASEVAGKVVAAYDVLQLVRGPKPAEGDPKRAVYDQAVLMLGNKNAGKAEEALMAGIMRTMEGPLAGKKKPDLGENASKLAAVGDSINAELNNPEYIQRYANIGYYGSKAGVNVAADARSEGEVKAVPGMGTSEQSRIVYQNDFDFGRLFYTQFKDNTEVFAVGGTPSDEQLAIFGANETAASAFIASVANGIALSYGDHDISNAFLTGLATNLNGVTNTQVRSNAHFQEALRFIELAGTKNDMDERRDLLSRAMMELKDPSLGTLFNGLYQVANNQIVVAVDQRAVVVYSGKGTVMLDLYGSMDEFMGHLKSGEWKKYGRAVVSLGLSVAADYLTTSAEAYSTKQNIGGELQQVGDKKLVTGRGWAVNATPQLWLSSTTGARPTQVVLYANFGYLDITMDQKVRTVTPEGQVEEQTIKKGDPYLGIYGLEMRFPAGVKHTSWRIERAGVGAFGATGNWWKNSFALITFSHIPKKLDTDRMRVMIQATPAYRGLVDMYGEYQAIPSLELRGTWLHRIKEHVISVDPTASVQGNVKTGVWTVDGGLGIAWKPTSAWEFSVKGGVMGDASGIQTKRVPTTGYLSGGVKYYISAPKPSKSTAQAVPSRMTAPPEWNEGVETAYDSAVALLDSKVKADKDSARGEKGVKLARELAAEIEGQVSLGVAPFRTVGEMPTYRRAVELLRVGKLKEGVAALRAAGLFE